MEVQTVERIETGGRIYKRGTGGGKVPQYEVCLERGPAEEIVRRAWMEGRLLYIELVDDGRAIPVLKQPYKAKHGVCFLLHTWLNSLWEQLWLKYAYKTITVRVFLKGGEPS